jgi:hypothetical protein
MKTEQEILSGALEKWSDLQVVIAIEELSELQKALCKYMRNRESSRFDDSYKHTIGEEIADVEIMCDQLRMYFGCTETVREYRKQKINRLEERIWGKR